MKSKVRTAARLWMKTSYVKLIVMCIAFCYSIKVNISLWGWSFSVRWPWRLLWVVMPCSGQDVSYEDGGCRNLRNGALLPKCTASRPRKVSVYCTWKYACNFDVKGKQWRVHEEQRLDFIVLTAWLVVYKCALRHWWYVGVGNGLEWGNWVIHMAYDVILCTSHLVSGLIPFRNWKKKSETTFFYSLLRALWMTLLLAGSDVSHVCPFSKSNVQMKTSMEQY
jgi:hypothetical protein